MPSADTAEQLKADVTALDLVASSDAAGPRCVNGLASRWHATSTTQAFVAVARQPDGSLIAAGEEGWQRFSSSDGALLGSWVGEYKLDVVLLAVSGNGSFVLAGRSGSIATLAQFAADGTQLAVQSEVAPTAWGPWLGTATGFLAVAFNSQGPADAMTATVHRLDGGLVPKWSAKLPVDALSAQTSIGLAETATGGVLVAGSVPFDVDSPHQGWAKLYGIDPSGKVDDGQWLGTGYATVRRLGPWLADGRLFARVERYPDSILYHTGLFAWHPTGLDDLGLETSVDLAGMSKSFVVTSDATVLSGVGAPQLAWLLRRWYGGGAGHASCQQLPGELGIATLPVAATPATVTLAPPASCVPTNAKCPMTTYPMAMVALPDGELVVTGRVLNCTGSADSAEPGKVRSGWLARYRVGCKP